METAVVLWLALAAVVGFLASSRGRNGAGWFALAIVISPLLAGIGLLFVPTPTPSKERSRARSQSFEPQDVLNGIPYDINSDGSITAMMPGGLVRFKTKGQFLAAASGSSTVQSGVMREPRNDAELIAFINSVLGLPVSDSVISELSGYKKQIESGIIQVDDRKYVVDLCRRVLRQKDTAASGTSAEEPSPT